MRPLGHPTPLVEPLTGGVPRSTFHYCFLGGAVSIIIVAVLLGLSTKSKRGSLSVALGIKLPYLLAVHEGENDIVQLHHRASTLRERRLVDVGAV